MKAPDELRGLKLTLAVYIVIFAMKLGAYLMSGVMALLAESLHTLSDIFISGFLLVATYYSRKQADRVHMFGYGRAQNVAALVAATLFISFTSYKLYEEAIPRLFNPAEASYQNLGLALGVIGLSMLLAAAPLITLFREKARGAAAKAQLIELVNDELGLLAALLGTLFILWGWPIADPIATLVVATIIAINAIGLLRENSSLLLGKSPGAAFLTNVETAARAVPGVLDVLGVRAEFVGPDAIHADVQVAVQPDTTVLEAERIGESVKARIHQELPDGFCWVGVGPARRVWRGEGPEAGRLEGSPGPMAGSLTDALEAEHRVIEKVVAVAQVLAETLESGAHVDPALLNDIVSFMRTYADKQHHGKEEVELFPVLVRRGVPTQGCPLGALNGDHVEGRRLVAALADAAQAYAAGDPEARHALLTSLRGITTLYPNHIWKEDFLLFPMCNKVLSEADQEELQSRFREVDAKIERGAHEHFAQLAADLEIGRAHV